MITPATAPPSVLHRHAQSNAWRIASPRIMRPSQPTKTRSEAEQDRAPTNSYRVKRPGDTGIRYHGPPTITLVNLPAAIMINIG